MMYDFYFYSFLSPFSIFGPLFIILLAWSLIWKGIALWKCGRNNQLYWFVALLIINTLGILEIIYLLFFQKNLNPRITHLDHIPKNLKRKSKRK